MNENEEKACDQCLAYEHRTKFCRLNPPTPVTIQVKDKQTDEIKHFVVSKYPVISFPETDFCLQFVDKNLLILS